MPGATIHHYLIALGSNRWHPRHGPPRATLRAALAALASARLALVATGPLIASRPLGPSRRTYANGAAVIATPLDPPALLATLHRIESQFGRRRRGQAWGDRVLDLDIVLWSGGRWDAPGLTIPHRAFHQRRFVLAPAVPIARSWRDPVSHFTIGQLHARLTAPRPLPKSRRR